VKSCHVYLSLEAMVVTLYIHHTYIYLSLMRQELGPSPPLESDSRSDLRNFAPPHQIASQRANQSQRNRNNYNPHQNHNNTKMFAPLRPRVTSNLSNTPQQIRHASLLRRPKRPYTFTQLITLSDGSTYLHRTTAPTPIYKSTKDTKNNPLWNPSSQKLANVEEDEAGRLKRFRGRFGRGWDAEVVVGGEEVRARGFSFGWV
jgi:hypothetical protein